MIVWFLLIGGLASGGTNVWSQTSSPPPGGRSGVFLKELPFQVYLRRADDGELVLVPDFSLEEYLRLYEQAASPAINRPPKFVIRNVEVVGEIGVDGAELTARAVIERMADANAEGQAGEEWIAIPLRMGEAALRESPAITGDGKSFVTFDMRTRGYVLWWHAAPGSHLEARLPLELGVSSVNGRRGLRWSMPAATTTHWTLTMREAASDLELIGEGTAELRSVGGNRTELIASGIRGDVEVTWGAATTPAATRLDVEGDIRVTIAGLQQVTSEATLTVRPLSGEAKRIQVRIPPRMTLRTAPDSLFEFQLLEEDAEQGSLYAVSSKSEEGVKGDWVIRLVCEANPKADANANGVAQWEPARFVVDGAARQVGRVQCEVQGEWAVMADYGPRVSRLSGEGLAFRYHTQPARLALTVRRRLARGRVESSHAARVDRDRVEMVSRFAYDFAGSAPQLLKIDCQGWRLVDALLDGEPLVRPAQQGPDGIVTMQVTSESVIGSDMTVELFLERTIGAMMPADERRLRFDVPRAVPFAEGTLFVAPATLEVERATDVELIPLVAELQGLMFVTNGDEPDQAAKLVLRERGTQERATFTAFFRTYDRSAQVDEEVVLAESRGQWRWTQYLTFRIDYQPGFRLRFAVPWVADSPLFDGVECVVVTDPADRGPLDPDLPRLNLRRVAPGSQAGLPDDWTVVEAILPNPELGAITIAIQVALADARDAEQTSWSLEVPWWVPLQVDETDVIRGEQHLTLEASRQIRAAVEDPTWTDVVPASGALQWVASEPVTNGVVKLALTLAEATRATEATVHRRWIQSWLTDVERRDRVVWNLTSDRQLLRIQLPAEVNAAADNLQLALEGKPVETIDRGSDGVLTVLLDPQDVGRPLAVELWYRQDRRSTSRRLVLHAPRLVRSQPPPITYWQVVVPYGEHFWSVAAKWSPEVRWRSWGRIWWRREWPGQEDFERWSGASFQPPLPDSVHAYAFSTFGAPDAIELQTISRAYLVAGVSGLMLLCGWLFMTIRLLRRPAMLLVVGAGVVAGVLWSPFLAATIAETAVIGVGCLVVALWLHWFVQRPRAMRPVAVPPSPSGQHVQPRSESGMTTMTAPAVAHGSSVESVR